MEHHRSTMILLAAVVVVVASLVTQSSSTIENTSHRCGAPHGTCAGNCEPGRCCSGAGYCQDPASDWCCSNHPGDGRAGGHNCWAPCTSTTSTKFLVNATCNGYLDGRRRYVTEGGDMNTTSFSCADSSFSRVWKQYPWAAFLAVEGQSQTNITSASSNCGRCLKVTNVGVVGGVRREVTVRIVHERISSDSSLGIELDSNGFKQLDIDGSGKVKGQLMVKYQFMSC